MYITQRLRQICEEAHLNHTISYITADERQALADLYQMFTKQSLDLWCDACIYQAALTVYHRIKKEG